MINKKILAVAVATAFTTNAFAAQDLSDDAAEAVVFASEFVTAAATLDVTNLSGAGGDSDLDVTSPFGFSIGDGTSKYIRLELTDATFLTPVVAGDFTVGGSETYSISQGGGAGDSSVVVEVSASGADVQQTDVWLLAATDFTISQSASSSVMYTLHDTAADAVNDVNPLSTQTGPLASVGAITSGTFTTPLDSTATVASAFMDFDAAGSDAVSATIGLVGSIDTSLYIDGTGFMDDGSLVVPADLITAGQDVAFAGDMSFGAWNTATAADCTTGLVALTGEDEDGADDLTVADVNVELFLCVVVTGAEVINKGDYSATLVTDDLSNDIGEISYDTTSVEVPYLTTFADYNQRVYMVNYSASDAAYSITFVSEAEATTTAGTAASGVIPAGEMIAIKATDIVTLTGRTRTSAVIEIEAVDGDISAATQSVNLSDGSTDTTVLN
jgi:hypothetical protein